MLTAIEYADAQGVSERTVKRWLQARELPGATLVNGRWLIPDDAVRDVPTEAIPAEQVPRGGVVAAPHARTLPAALDLLPAFLTLEQAAQVLGVAEGVVKANAEELDGRRWGPRGGAHGRGPRAWVIPQASIRRLGGL